MVPAELSSKQVSYLRGLAHALTPSVQMGKAGMTPAIVKEIDRNLKDHELIKVRINCDERAEFMETAETLAQSTAAALVQTIGRMAVFYREGPKRTIKLPTKSVRA